jgi:hypothetical protein
MSFATIDYKKYVERYFKNDKYHNTFNFNQKRFFLICENCFWMASTIPSVRDIDRLQHKKCPVCINNVNRFLICDESF